LLVAERRPLPECPVRPMLVEMPDVGDQHVLEVAATEDQQPVETLPTDAADPALGMGTRLWRAELSRSRIKNCGRMPSSSSCISRLRACWATQRPSGWS
jgi:hypothetical protein